MSPDTAEMAVADAPAARMPFAAPAPATSAIAPGPGAARGGLARLREDLRSDPARIAAVRETWRALWISRLLVWVAGAGTVAALGFGPVRNAFDPGVMRGFGWLGDLLAAPAARWDASWYLVIAHYGYRPELGSFTSARDAFFPLYPLGLRALSDLGLQAVLAGVVFSLAALALALYGIHRLTALELGGSGRPGAGDVARLAVLLTALAPMAFYFSAVYSESLYLALSVGVFLCARQGRWARAGALGALAAATRSTGVVLLAPALMLYLYGPREDRAPDFELDGWPRAASKDRAPDFELNRPHDALALGLAPASKDRAPDFELNGWPRAASKGRALGFALARRLRPRYRLRGNAAWLGLLPAGLAVYVAYLGLSGGDAMAPFHAQEVWGRHFAGPYLGVWDGVKAAFEGARQLLSAQRTHVYFPIAAGSPFIAAGHNLMLLAFLLAAVGLVIGVVRMLPLAYGVYTIAALALPLSYPVAPQPLMSLPRFLVVLFPLSMVLAAWLAARPRARMPALAASALLMMFFGAQFATWHWVA
ncbi:MAG TPA: mannosyltransferase family protein [Solirubrobacteraceae bacterium]|nr:mannosyltransferase family protein [Solirubrobacteraceae bacterium]